MDEYTRQHDPDQMVPSDAGAQDGVRDPQTQGVPEAERPPAECREAECPRQLQPTAPPRQGFWGSLTETEQAALLACAEEVVYPVGTVLWFENQVADQAIVIRSGSVRISVERDGREHIIAFRRPGDIVGERAALLLRRRSATVVAMDTVHGLRMTTQQFVTYLSDYPRVVAVMEREVYDRLTEQYGQAPQTPVSFAHAAHQGPQPHPRVAQPYPTGAPPYVVSTPPQATPTPVYATWAEPQLASVPPNATSPQPYAVSANPYAATPPNAMSGQPYLTSVQPYATAAGPTPLSHPQMGHVPYPAAAGGGAYTVQSPVGASWPVQQDASARVPSHAQPTQPMAIVPPGQMAQTGQADQTGQAERAEQVGQSWAGRNCTIVYTDIAGFSAPHRNDADRLDMRRALYKVLREAFKESGVPWDACHVEDRGDGTLIVVPPEVPTAAVVDPMLTELARGLRRHNRRSSGAVRIQLRVALGVGPVMPDPPGVTGFALIHTARLLDARPLKDRLAMTGADLGVIASQFVYESFIAHGDGCVDPAEYEPVSCQVKKFKTEGWIHLRGASAQPAV